MAVSICIRRMPSGSSTGPPWGHWSTSIIDPPPLNLRLHPLHLYPILSCRGDPTSRLASPSLCGSSFLILLFHYFSLHFSENSVANLHPVNPKFPLDQPTLSCISFMDTIILEPHPMTDNSISRRDFMKLSSATLLGLLLPDLTPVKARVFPHPHREGSWLPA